MVFRLLCWMNKGRSLALPAHSIEPGRKMLVAVRNPTQIATLLTTEFWFLIS